MFGEVDHVGVRLSRIKINPSNGEACYHCVTRTVNGAFLFDDAAKEVLRRLIWRISDYCGVKIITYAILSNHFHVLVQVPARASVSDEELLRRYRVLYPKPTRYQSALLSTVLDVLAENGPRADAWRRRQLALMGDISQFMKLLKQRFSIWFNKAHQRFGTLWAERFKSVLLESRDDVLATVAAYIDLNAVRAGMVSDPKDYRFCGYGEAVAGCEVARSGLRCLSPASDWKENLARYRLRLFTTGSAGPEGAVRISAADLEKVLAERGHLPLPAILRCRVRYFTDGAVLGGRAFVHAQLEASRTNHGRMLRRGAQPLPPVVSWGDLTTMTAIRSPGFG